MDLLIYLLIFLFGYKNDGNITIAVVDNFNAESIHGITMFNIISYQCNNCPIEKFNFNKGYDSSFEQSLALLKACLSKNDIINYSIAGDNSDVFLFFITKLCVKNEKIIITSSGNDSDNNVNYPCGYDEYVICIGGLKASEGLMKNIAFTNNEHVDFYYNSIYNTGLHIIEG
ncbi:MAG: hypothetical protein KC414_05970, partial [Romboutsia sp.]|nr:hypothetical protein [Romboutsia sp.]